MRINLLPPEIQRRRIVKQQIIFGSILLIIYIFFLTLIYFYLLNRNAKAEEEFKETQQCLTKYKQVLSRVDELEKNLIPPLENMLKFSGEVKRANAKWIEILKVISVYTPKDVWFTQITFTPPSTLSISANTNSITSIAKCALIMMECPYFSNVTLGQTSFTINGKGKDGGTDGTGAAISFPLTITLKESLSPPAVPGVPAAPTEEEAAPAEEKPEEVPGMRPGRRGGGGEE